MLSTNYKEISTNYSAALFCVIHLKWDYIKCTLQLLIPDYVKASLSEFSHPNPKKRKHIPHVYQNPNYGAKVQLTNPETTANSLNKSGINKIQRVVRKLLYYARAVDGTILAALSPITSEKY